MLPVALAVWLVAGGESGTLMPPRWCETCCETLVCGFGSFDAFHTGLRSLELLAAAARPRSGSLLHEILMLKAVAAVVVNCPVELYYSVAMDCMAGAGTTWLVGTGMTTGAAELAAAGAIGGGMPLYSRL